MLNFGISGAPFISQKVRVVKFCILVGYINSYQTDEKSPKRCVVMVMRPIKILIAPKISPELHKLEILYTGPPVMV